VRRPADPLVATLGDVAASGTFDDGRLVLLLNIGAFVQRLHVAGASGPARVVARAATRRARVLVVDDSPIIRDLITGVLRAAGFDVTSAEDGREALTNVDADPPDV